MEELLNNLPVFYALIATAVGYICAAIATKLDAPKEEDSTFYKVIYKIINWAGLNLAKAKNADEVK